MRALEAWQRVSRSEWILSVIRVGFSLLWDSSPAPLARRPPPFRLPASPVSAEALDTAVAQMVQSDAVEVVLGHSPGFYCRLFPVPKSTGGFRPVLDLSALNHFLRRVRFRMETPASFRAALRPGDFVTSIDLCDAYFHILIHPSHRKWLRFVWRDQVFQFRALPFGLSLSPWVFTMVVREFCALVRGQGIRLRSYLDDWAILANSAAVCSQQTQQTLAVASMLSFSVNLSESSLLPSQGFLFLGMEFDTVAWSVRPVARRIDQFLRVLRSCHLAHSRPES